MDDVAALESSDCRRRSEHLAQGIVSRRICVRSLVVLCCEVHAGDRLVGVGAGARLGVPTIAPEQGSWSADQLRLSGDELGRPLVLACEEGVHAWLDAGAHGQVIGDGEGVLWWRLVEARGRADLATDDRSAAC